MVWIYYNGRIKGSAESPYPEDNDILDVELFEHLTGKTINWKAREFTKIITKRVGGHIKIYDEHFIKGEAYKHKTGCYMCSHVAEDGTALLSKLGPNMIVKSAKHPITDLWECL